MKFSIIENEQTPLLPPMADEQLFVQQNSDLLNAFLQYAKDNARAIGLASNQCSVDGQRIMERFFVHKDMRTDEWEIVINPTILFYFGIKQNRIEYCLTWPRKKLIVERHGIVEVSYCNMQGERVKKRVEGFHAQIWQHEINHLNGIEERVVPLDFHEPTIKKFSRNEPCPCNSGKKYKQCCKTINEDSPIVTYN